MFHGTKSWLKSAASFNYIVSLPPHGDQNESPFQLFPIGYLAVASAYQLLAELPRDALELVLTPNQMARERMTGRGTTAMAWPANTMSQLAPLLNNTIVVVLSATDELAEIASQELARFSSPLLHIHPAQPQIDDAVIINHLDIIAQHWDTVSHKAHLAALLRNVVHHFRRQPRVRATLPLNDPSHFVTQPNIVALRSLGFDPSRQDGSIDNSLENDSYFAHIKETSDAIFSVRDTVEAFDPAIKQLSSLDMILAAPSVAKYWNRNIDDTNLPGTVRDKQLVKSLARSIYGRSTFSIVIPGHLNNGDVLNNPYVGSILRLYRRELELTTSMLAFRAASTFAPVIRLSPGHNSADYEVGNLMSAIRKGDERRSPHKINRLVRRVSERLSVGVPRWVIERLKLVRKVKIFSDAPLEWMDVDGIPLMLRVNASRIPSTPGSLSMMQTMSAAEIYVPKDKFKRVLLIRSFHQNDPLKYVLEKKINDISAGNAGFPEIVTVDVTNRNELIAALNDYDGAVLIFNGHGHYSRKDKRSQLVLSDELVDPWSLRTAARVPPIVVLAACDTQPLDGSQWTSANGFLAAGAVSVLGTAMPVTAETAARIVARLLSRIANEFPLLMERQWRSLRWSEVLPGLQRSEFALHAITRLRKSGIVRMTDDASEELLINVHERIVRGDDWIAALIAGVERYRACSTPAATLLQRHCGFIESMVFVQLGNPENVVVWDPDVPPEWYEQFPKPTSI